ncbi:hypothetical protein [Rugamonas apoptosis]|uniref:Lipoprotein n=1 Tax=Rugamonas apoptosis TaxID=2758570 RepID=A0A7W2IN19_9BURK|nr:hypothetical protein [Rugamonas apoptosis]MBA5690244.1 hypothetical protein [Rugamonas apoptosis]
MKHAFALTSLALALSACTSAPKLTLQEQEAQRVSTLKVYADNRVGMKTVRDWLWTWEPNTILAIEVNSRAYNVKDVESINREQKELIVVSLANGEQLKTHPGRFHWLSCDTSKVCSSSGDILTSNYKVSFHGSPRAIEKVKLQNPDTIKLGNSNITDNPRTAIVDGSIPVFYNVGDRVDVLKDAELTKLNERITTVLKDWDAKAPERAARQEREFAEFKAAAQRQLDHLRNASTGTQAYCERALQENLPSGVSLDCPNYGRFSIDDFKNAGWNVAAINTTPIVDGIGRPFTMYRVSFQKVR